MPLVRNIIGNCEFLKGKDIAHFTSFIWSFNQYLLNIYFVLDTMLVAKAAALN